MRTLLILFSLNLYLLITGCGAKPPYRLFSVNHSTPQITNDTDSQLEKILEYDRTKNACPKYWELLNEDDQVKPDSDPNSVYELEILCGKWLFTSWETSGKMPLPEILFDAMERSWPDKVGENFSNLGFLPNPSDPSGRPLGIARSTTRYTGMPSVNVTCAACHIGQLPDGRYAIGAPNTKLNLSEFNLMSYYPLYAAMHNQDRAVLPTEVSKYYQNLEQTERRRVLDGAGKVDWSNIVFKYSKLLHWIGLGPKGLPDAKFVVMPPDRDLMSWINGRPGVFNPGAPMLTIQVKDVPNLSIPQLWGIKGYEQDYLLGKTAPVGQTTKYASLEKFISSAFIYSYQDLSLVRKRNIQPLVSYIRQLNAPKTMESIQFSQTVEGSNLFNNNCKSCHDGSAGESTRLYPALTTGSHPSLDNPRANYVATTPIAKLIDDLSNQLAVDLRPQPSGLRSRRLTGVWARKNLMIDGSVEDLEDLFCINGKRTRENSPHIDLCDSFSSREKSALINFLKAM